MCHSPVQHVSLGGWTASSGVAPRTVSLFEVCERLVAGRLQGRAALVHRRTAAGCTSQHWCGVGRVGRRVSEALDWSCRRFRCRDQGPGLPLREHWSEGIPRLVGDPPSIRGAPEGITPSLAWIVRSAGLTCLTCHSTCRPLTAMIGHSAWRTCRNSLILQTHKPQRHNPALSLSHSPSLKIPPTAVKLTTTTPRQPRPWHLTRPISLWWRQGQAQGLVPVRVQAPPSTAQRRQTTLEGDCLRSCNQRPENNYVLTTCSGAAQPLMQHPRQLSRSVHPPSLS